MEVQKQSQEAKLIKPTTNDNKVKVPNSLHNTENDVDKQNKSI